EQKATLSDQKILSTIHYKPITNSKKGIFAYPAKKYSSNIGVVSTNHPKVE
ncbi:MAG: hypothetical protein FD167_2518, partial [bacterium]